MSHTAVIKALKFIAVWLLTEIWICRDETGGTDSLLTEAFVLKVRDNSAYSNLSTRLRSTSSRVETEVAASVTEPAPHSITAVIGHERRQRKKGNGCLLSSVRDLDFLFPNATSCSSPRKARKRLNIHSVKRKNEKELLGLDWLQLVGASNSTARNAPDVQILSEWYRVAEVLEERGMPLDSMRVLKRIVLADPKQEMAWLRIVDLHKAIGEISQAISVLKMALSVYPTCGSLWFALANIAKESGYYQQACLLYIKASRLLCKGTTTANPWSAWGWMEVERGNPQQARKVLEIGIVEAKKRNLKVNPRLWHSYGVLMDQCGQSSVALEAFSQGLRVAPMDLKLRTAQGIALYRSGYIKEAKRAFRSVLNIQRTHPEASFCLGYIEECEGNFYGARLFYEASTSSIAILAQNDLYPLGLMALARMEIKRKEFDRAVEVYSEAASLFPFNPDILSDWATAEALRGDDEVAQSLFERAIASAKDKKTAARSLKKAALFEIKCGNTTRGRNLLFRAVLNTVSDEDFFLILPAWAKMEWQLGNRGRARLAMQFAVRLWDGKPKQAHIVKTWSKLEHEDGNLALASHLALQYLNAVGGDDTEAWNILAKIAGQKGELESQCKYSEAARRAVHSEKKQEFKQHRDLYAEMVKHR